MIKSGDWIAQLVIELIFTPIDSSNMPKGVRGGAGFGSTDMDSKIWV